VEPNPHFDALGLHVVRDINMLIRLDGSLNGLLNLLEVVSEQLPK
jgi:hypothetical protein